MEGDADACPSDRLSHSKSNLQEQKARSEAKGLQPAVESTAIRGNPSAPSSPSSKAERGASPSSKSNKSSLRRVKQLDASLASAIETESGIQLRTTGGKTEVFRLILQNQSKTVLCEATKQTRLLLITVAEAFSCEEPISEETSVEDPASSVSNEDGNCVELELCFFRGKPHHSSLKREMGMIPVLHVDIRMADGMSQAIEFLGMHQRKYFIESRHPSDAIEAQLEESLLKVALEFLFHPSRNRYSKPHLVVRECSTDKEVLSKRQELVPLMVEDVVKDHPTIKNVTITYEQHRRHRGQGSDIANRRSYIVLDEVCLKANPHVQNSSSSTGSTPSPRGAFSGFKGGFLQAKRRPNRVSPSSPCSSTGSLPGTPTGSKHMAMGAGTPPGGTTSSGGRSSLLDHTRGTGTPPGASSCSAADNRASGSACSSAMPEHFRSPQLRKSGGGGEFLAGCGAPRVIAATVVRTAYSAAAKHIASGGGTSPSNSTSVRREEQPAQHVFGPQTEEQATLQEEEKARVVENAGQVAGMLLPSADVTFSSSETEARQLQFELHPASSCEVQQAQEAEEEDELDFGDDRAGLNSLADHLFGDGTDGGSDALGLMVEFDRFIDDRTESTKTPSPKASDIGGRSEMSEAFTERSDLPDEDAVASAAAAPAVGIRHLQQRKKDRATASSSSSTVQNEEDDLIARWMKQRW